MAVQAPSLKLASVIAIDAGVCVCEGPGVRRIGVTATSSGASGSDFLLFSRASFVSAFTAAIASGRPTLWGNVSQSLAPCHCLWRTSDQMARNLRYCHASSRAWAEEWERRLGCLDIMALVEYPDQCRRSVKMLAVQLLAAQHAAALGGVPW